MTVPSALGRLLRSGPWLAALPLLAACGGGVGSDFPPVEFEAPVTAVAYEVELRGAPSEEIAALLQESLSLYRRQEDGAQSLPFLRRRAREDVEVAQRVLRSFGYYGAEVAVAIVEPDAVEPEAEEVPEEEIADSDAAEEEPGETPLAVAVVEIDPGPAFTLASHDFVYTDFGLVPPPALRAEALGSPVGGPAVARAILEAEAEAVAQLRSEGYPYAEFTERDSVADLDAHEIMVDSYIFAGRPYVFGEIQFVGLEDVEPDYLRTYRTFEPGAPWDVEKAREYQRELVGTNLFNVVSATPPEDPPPGEAAPVVVRLEERPFRTVALGVRYGTDTGPAVRAAFEHRNLFGENEQFNAELTASGLIGDAAESAGFGTDELGEGPEAELQLSYREPQYLRPGQDFLAGFNARHIEDDAFDETAATLTAGLEREITDELSVGAGGLLEYSEINDDDEETVYYLVGAPLFVRYDNANSLLNPTSGARWRLDLAPITGTTDDGRTPLFARIDANGSTYYGLDEDDDFVLAGRARVGSVLTTKEDLVPASRRLFSGGGGSVRGYAERSIGPLDEDGDPEGGLSVVELAGEVRATVYENIGAVAFAGVGSVSEDPYPTFEDPRYAAGVGVRYYSPVGPIRLDVAFPINPRPSDDAWQLYVSIGQAF